jgi:hypothetical protein
VLGPAGTPAAATVPALAPVSTAAIAAVQDHVIVLAYPAVQNTEVTTRNLVVRGHLPSGGGSVAVVLESSGSKVIAIETVRPIRDPSGRRSTFSATFPLSNPRPGGRMVVQVIAYDRAGVPIDSLRRRVRIGAIVPDDPGTRGPRVRDSSLPSR